MSLESCALAATEYMLAARRVAVRAAAAAMSSYATARNQSPVRDDSVYDHPPFALR